MVVLVVGKVDSAAADLDAAGENRLVDALAVKALAAERRDQGRMNVQDAEAEILRDVNQLQEARHANDVGLRLAAEGEDALAECFCGCVILPGNDIAGKPGAEGAGHAECVRPAGHDLHDAGAEPAVRNAVDEVLQRRAATT